MPLGARAVARETEMVKKLLSSSYHLSVTVILHVFNSASGLSSTFLLTVLDSSQVGICSLGTDVSDSTSLQVIPAIRLVSLPFVFDDKEVLP